jgi:hypothetical protein
MSRWHRNTHPLKQGGPVLDPATPTQHTWKEHPSSDRAYWGPPRLKAPPTEPPIKYQPNPYIDQLKKRLRGP